MNETCALFHALEFPGGGGAQKGIEVRDAKISRSRIMVLVATYHGCCRDWILGGSGGCYYNIPFHRDDSEAAKSSRIKMAFLYGDDGSVIYCRLSYERIASREELYAMGYPSKAESHAKKYILFKISSELSSTEIAEVISNPLVKFYIFADAFSKNKTKHLHRLVAFLEKIGANHKNFIRKRMLLPKEGTPLSQNILGQLSTNEDENPPINVDSLWIIGPRAKGAKRINCYHGNFVPQIPNDLIRRYTSPGDLVLDMFMGSGTTLYECERLNRNFVGFDINGQIIDFVKSQMDMNSPIRFEIHNSDVTNTRQTELHIRNDLEKLGKNNFDFIIMHPPYLDIVKFTDNQCDLSRISDLDVFIAKFKIAVAACVRFLAQKKYFALVIGDLYRNSEVVPLGFMLMEAVKDVIQCKLKGIVVKDMVGNRGKIGQEALWRARALRGGYYLFKHEYVFVFRKEK